MPYLPSASARLDELVRDRARAELVAAGRSLLAELRDGGFTPAEAAREVESLLETAAPIIATLQIRVICTPPADPTAIAVSS